MLGLCKLRDQHIQSIWIFVYFHYSLVEHILCGRVIGTELVVRNTILGSSVVPGYGDLPANILLNISYHLGLLVISVISFVLLAHRPTDGLYLH